MRLFASKAMRVKLEQVACHRGESKRCSLSLFPAWRSRPMPSRRTAPSVTSTPKPSPGAAKAPTRGGPAGGACRARTRTREAQERRLLAETLQEALERRP